MLVLSVLVDSSVSQFIGITVPPLFSDLTNPHLPKYPPLSPFVTNFQNLLGSIQPFTPQKKSSAFLASLFVDKGKFGGNIELKKPGFSVKTTGITDFNGNNNVMVGLTIPIRLGRKRSRSRPE